MKLDRSILVLMARGSVAGLVALSAIAPSSRVAAHPPGNGETAPVSSPSPAPIASATPAPVASRASSPSSPKAPTAKPDIAAIGTPVRTPAGRFDPFPKPKKQACCGKEHMDHEYCPVDDDGCPGCGMG